MNKAKRYIKFHSNTPELLLLSAAIVASIIPLRWVLSSHFYFLADDWTWLYKAQFSSYRQLFNILPIQYYNDRAFGSVFIKIIYDIFGLNNRAFHVTLLLIHLVNVALVFYIAKRLFRSIIHAFFVSFLFGTYIAALTAVSDVGAVFDLLSNTLILTVFFLYLQEKKIFHVLSYVVLFFAFRTKELAILTPLFLLFYEFVGTSLPLDKTGVLRSLRKTKWYLIMMACFLLYYVHLFLTLHLRLPATDPYYESIKLKTFFDGLWFYISALAYVQIPEIGTLFIFFSTVVYMIFRNARIGLVGIFGFLLFLLPVVFLINHLYAIYLYVPLFPFILYVYDFLLHIAQDVKTFIPLPKIYKSSYISCAVVFVVTSYYFINIHNGYYKSEINWYLNLSNIYSNNISYIKQVIPEPEANATFYINNLPQSLNVFDLGPCYSLKLIYKENSLTCVIYKSPEVLEAMYAKDEGPKYLLEYENGQLKNSKN